MTAQPIHQLPNELLAQQIISRFLHEGLITDALSGEIQKLLLSPSPTPEDWQLIVEKILEAQTKGEFDGKSESN